MGLASKTLATGPRKIGWPLTSPMGRVLGEVHPQLVVLLVAIPLFLPIVLAEAVVVLARKKKKKNVGPRVSHTVGGQNYAPIETIKQPLFVGIYRGIMVPGFFRWCRISSIHSTSLCSSSGHMEHEVFQLSPSKPKASLRNRLVLLLATCSSQAYGRFLLTNNLSAGILEATVCPN